MRFRLPFVLIPVAALALASCTAFFAPDFAPLAEQPLAAEPKVRGTDAWYFGERAGTLIQTQHFRIYTMMGDPIFQHLLVRVLEATYDRGAALAHFQTQKPMDCYVFASRGQWENYTRAKAGSNAPIYLQIASGGYCQEGVFAGYDIGREQTLSVIAHEAWHQYSWFAFKDRLPSWLEEGLATQNEAIRWEAAQPVFRPEMNAGRSAALRQAWRAGTLWKLTDLLATHAGRVIKMPQPAIDAYYAQLWSLVLFLQRSPIYGPRLENLLADAAEGRLVRALEGTTVTAQEIANFTEHWNMIAGPAYLRKYLNPDIDVLEREYLEWMREFVHAN